MTTVPTITALPAAPSTSAPSTFEALMDALLAALPTMVTEENLSIAAINTVGTEITASAAAASASAAAALASAAAAIAAPGTAGTSTTSASIGTGTKSLTIQTGKSIVPGMWVMVAVTASTSTNYMVGVVSTYDSGTGALDFTVPAGYALGSGSYAAWTVSLTGPPADAATLAAHLGACIAVTLLF